MIKPTLGRVLYYHRSPDVVHAAIIANVLSDGELNLTAFDSDGRPYPAAKVPLIQPEDERPNGPYCTWMPFQTGQTAASNSLMDTVKRMEAAFHQRLQSMERGLSEMSAFVSAGQTAPPIESPQPEPNASTAPPAGAADSAGVATQAPQTDSTPATTADPAES
jgi:hypothetical protein